MIHQRRRPLRLLAATLAGALALSAAPLSVGTAGAADALPPLANPIADGAVCDGAPTTNPFTDLGGESAATRQTIICLVNTGITTGVTATTYVPGGTVTRRQMALVHQAPGRPPQRARALPAQRLSRPTTATPDYPDHAAEDASVRGGHRPAVPGATSSAASPTGPSAPTRR